MYDVRITRRSLVKNALYGFTGALLGGGIAWVGMLYVLGPRGGSSPESQLTLGYTMMGLGCVTAAILVALTKSGWFKSTS